MEPFLIFLVLILGLICGLLYLLLLFFGRSKNDILWAILFGILGFMCFGVVAQGIPDGLLAGVFIGGLLELGMIPSVLLTRYRQRKGLKILDNIRRSSENETLRKIADTGWKLGKILYRGNPNDPTPKI